MSERAKSWFDDNIHPHESIDNFKRKFLREYYSVQARIEFKENWSSRRFKSADKSVCEYFKEVHLVRSDSSVSRAKRFFDYRCLTA